MFLKIINKIRRNKQIKIKAKKAWYLNLKKYSLMKNQLNYRKMNRLNYQINNFK